MEMIENHISQGRIRTVEDGEEKFICGYCTTKEIAFDEDGCFECLLMVREMDEADKERKDK